MPYRAIGRTTRKAGAEKHWPPIPLTGALPSPFEILRFREQAGEVGTLVYAGMDWVDAKLAKRSMELMATEVMPRVNAAIAGYAGTPARLATR